MKLSMIVAVADNYGIGLDNKLPWAHNVEDMRWFKAQTKGKPVVMGSSTWDSLPIKPLPDRINVVLSSRLGVPGADMVWNIDTGDIHQALKETFGDREVVIIGGAKVYEAMMPWVDRIYLTRIRQIVEADTYLHIDDLMEQHCHGDYDRFKLHSREQVFNPNVTFEIWDRSNYE